MMVDKQNDDDTPITIKEQKKPTLIELIKQNFQDYYIRMMNKGYI